MNDIEFNELKEKVVKLEKKSSSNLWLQFFIFPLILAGMGYYFQHIVEQSEKRMEQLKISQTIVNQVFNDTIVERTVIYRNILDEILDNDALAKKIQKSIDKYLKNKAITGTPEEAKEINNAINTFGSDNKSLKESFSTSTVIQQKVSKYDKAITKEHEAFTFLVNGELVKAKQAFKEVEQIYPSFHEAYGIWKYLEKSTPENPTQAQIKEIQNYIGTDMSWKAPKDLLPQLTQ